MESLPQSFIMKATHLHAMEGVVSVNNGTVTCLFGDVALCSAQKKGESLLTYLQRTCDALLSVQTPMKDRPKCLFEEQLPLFETNFFDYKFHVFHGKTMFIDISPSHFIAERDKVKFFRTPDWKELPEKKIDVWGAHLGTNNDTLGPRPVFLDELLEEASALHKAVEERLDYKLAFLRVDFIVVGTAHYFGEFTFYLDKCNAYFEKGSIANKLYGFVATHPELDIPASVIHVIGASGE